MYKQLIYASVLIVFTGFQLASSLKCYTCNSPNDCVNAAIVTCTNEAADATRVSLKPIMGDLPYVSGKKYQCINATVFLNSWKYADKMIAGCVFKEAGLCGTSSSTKNSRLFYFSSCGTCNTNLCTRNTASSFGNSLLTLAMSIVAVKMLSKA